MDEIDRKLKKAAQALGVDLPIGDTTGAVGPRLPPPAGGTPETIGSAMLNILLKADRGLSRSEVRDELVKFPKFNEQISRNANAYYNTVGRYLKRGWLVEAEKHLYHPERAPLPEGATDPTGQHLSSNVAPLFRDRSEKADG